jgi:hypothetical protein
LPDIEDRFWKTYRDQGLVVVALNAHDTLEQIGQVQQFTSNLGVTYDVGLEQTQTYMSLTQNFEGLNPFPLDIIVDRSGTIVHVTREYDPLALTQLIEELLAQ